MRESKIRASVVPVTMSKLSTATRTLNCEITVLSTESEKKESYIADVQTSLRLNKQASNIMFAEQIMNVKGQGKLLGRFRSVSWENMRILEELSKQRHLKEEAFAESLIVEQIRVQEQQYFEMLVEQRVQRVEDLRKTFHDKEYNYSVIAEKLARFEELEERFTCGNHIDCEFIFQDRHVVKTISRLSRDKKSLIEETEGYRNQLKELRESEQKTKLKLLEQPNYQKAMGLFRDDDEVLSDGADVRYRPDQEIDAMPAISTKKENLLRDKYVKELLRVLKKSRMNSEVMRLSLKQSLEIGAQLRIKHKQLLESTKNAEARLKKYKTRIDEYGRLLQRRIYPWLPHPQTAINSLLQAVQEDIVIVDDTQPKDFDSLLGNSTTMLIRCGSEPSFCETTVQ